MAGKESGLRMEPFLWTLFSAGGVLAAFLIPVHLWVGVSARLAESTGIRERHGASCASDCANLPAPALFAAAVSLGAPVSLHALRRLANQAFERGHQLLLLRWCPAGNSRGRLPAVEDSLKAGLIQEVIVVISTALKGV